MARYSDQMSFGKNHLSRNETKKNTAPSFGVVPKPLKIDCMPSAPRLALAFEAKGSITASKAPAAEA